MCMHWRLIAAGCLLLAVSWPAMAQHAEPASGGHETPAAHAPADGHAPAGDGGHDGEKPALLQFDPGAALWSIIVFVMLLVTLRLTAWKPILRALQDRENFIAKSIDDAKREREQAERLLADYRAQLDKAREEATTIVEEGRRDSEVVGRRVQDEARAEAAAMVERARREIRLATETAIHELYNQTANLAVEVAGGIIRKELSADDHRQLVTDSLKAMEELDRTKLN